ncbi:MurR/RpiR family transcriptional regulator [Massiliimalia massiliensis]|uniref:MurR/RpiR family transcriptional regulator n=1 Tax=Massiliimalia massiliensis TaxID=1852384 RepID=UPI0009870150|nr:MurR/RpiR family transcriptional regulator [Massiliimalia massiliensis]
MKNDILYEIAQRMDSLSKGQKRIATYILNHYDKAAFMTASKLGTIVGVSESTVVRFAFELGYDGYPKLQRQLQEMIRNRLTAVQRIEVASEQLGSEEILDKVLNLDIEKIRRTLEETSRDDFNGAVQSIVRARSIYIIGARSAATLASFIAFYFHLIFENVRLVQTTSASEMFEQILRIGEEDIIIGISFPRYSKKTVKALNYAHSRNARVIAITDSISSPLVKESDYFLQARSDMASFVDSLVAPLSLINALIMAVGLQKQEELKHTFDKLEEIWDEYDVYEKAEADNAE